jgi:hypothetical protein
MKRLIITEEEKHYIKSLYEQTTGTTKPIDLNYILAQSESGKTNNDFCKSKTGYDVCMFVQSSNPRVIQGKYDIRKNILTKSGYSMVGEDKTKSGIITSIWKKQ